MLEKTNNDGRHKIKCIQGAQVKKKLESSQKKHTTMRDTKQNVHKEHKSRKPDPC